MKKYEVTLHGKNFMLNINGEHKKFGFHASRFVIAKDMPAAEKIAAIMIHKHPIIKDAIINEGVDSPKIRVTRTGEVNSLIYFFKKGENGFEFYSEED